MEGESAAAVRAVVEPTVRELGYDLILVELAGAGGRRTLRLYIDRDGGIGIADCVRVSRQVSPLLDVEEPVFGPYVLEVSSPGIERPLGRPDDFERFTGSRVKLSSRRLLDGRRVFTGRLLGLQDGVVAVEEDDGRRYHVPYDALKAARLDVPAEPSEGSTRRQRAR